MPRNEVRSGRCSKDGGSLKAHEHEYVCDVIEKEGFDYAFVHYSNFGNIDDEQFHVLRKKYLAARKEFADYVGETTVCD